MWLKFFTLFREHTLVKFCLEYYAGIKTWQGKSDRKTSLSVTLHWYNSTLFVRFDTCKLLICNSTFFLIFLKNLIVHSYKWLYLTKKFLLLPQMTKWLIGSPTKRELYLLALRSYLNNKCIFYVYALLHAMFSTGVHCIQQLYTSLKLFSLQFKKSQVDFFLTGF